MEAIYLMTLATIMEFIDSSLGMLKKILGVLVLLEGVWVLYKVWIR